MVWPLTIARVPIPISANALPAIAMIDLGPHVKVFYTYVITIIIKFIVEWCATHYSMGVSVIFQAIIFINVTVYVHNKQPWPVFYWPA